MKPDYRNLLKQFRYGMGYSLLIGGVFLALQLLANPASNWPALKRMSFVLVFLAFCYTAVAIPLASLFFKNLRFTHITAAVVFRGVLFLLVLGVLGALAAGVALRTGFPEMGFFKPRFYLTTVLWVVFLGLPLFLFNLVRELWKEAVNKVREKEVAQERLEKELLAAQLRNLQAQVNPHFFFNALNSIAALITVEPRKAEAMVEKLAGLFRYALDCDHGGQISLAEELKFAEDYLAIARVRYGERMNYRLEANPDLLGQPLPPLLIQPLVENAIKHGISRTEESGSVEVTVRQKGDHLELTVENDGPPPPCPDSRGLGLSNVESRCRLVYGAGFHFSLNRTEAGRTRAQLTVPMASIQTSSL